MNKKVIMIGLAAALLLSACGAGEPPVPTIDPNSIVSTAQAAAFTMIAQTQAAIPTATATETPLPTPVPTDTPIPSPTLDPATLPSPTATSGTIGSDDPCWHPLPGDAPGNPTVLRIKNKTNGPITITVYLYQKTAFGECGYRVYDIAKGESVTLNDALQGNYALTAFVNNRKNISYGTAMVYDTHLVDFEVYVDYIKVIYP